MKNWVSLTKLIHTPTSMGMMWISSSSNTAGSTSRYGVAFPHEKGRRRRRDGASTRVGFALTVVVMVVVGASAAGRSHLVLGFLQGGLDVTRGDRLSRGRLCQKAIDGVAHVGLEGRLRRDQRQRLRLAGQDVGEGLGLVLVRREVDGATLDDRQRGERLVEDGLLL